MAPEVDKDFLEKLHLISPDLSVKFNNVLKCFVIYYESNGVFHRIHEVKNDDGSFRQLDDRVIQMLRRCDTHRNGEEALRNVDEQIARAKKQRADDILKHKKEIAYQSQQKLSRWKKAIDNFLYKNIVSPNQLDQRRIISYPGISSENSKLIKKLGVPKLASPKIIFNP